MSKQTTMLIQILRQKREASGYSLRKLSSIIGVSFSTLARIERGEGEPDNNTKARILEWLGDDARRAGIKFENVAFVHFRAQKNIDSETVHALLNLAIHLKAQYAKSPSDFFNSSNEQELEPSISLSKSEMEEMAELFRIELGLMEDEPLNPFEIRVEGVEVIGLSDIPTIDIQLKNLLQPSGRQQWDAMSIPLSKDMEKWIIVWNDKRRGGRKNVSLLEEYWHILQGHKLTRMNKVADVYGRTFGEVEEHDAYYLAAATLLPAKTIKRIVNEKEDIIEAADRYGVSKDLIEYRIKRLGLWRKYKGIEISLQQVQPLRSD
jgi:transcriptional regulator with XRE-family HTH domain